ncbi:hypothetical protein BDR04DRAFT_1143775 [Suillus decipiens]|nr:hypothetical protein BDR04DRAFT_1143775 [Suillus decipiens]
MSKLYVCSAEPGCNQNFTKFVDFKRHEAAHSKNGHICTWPGCDFATKIKSSYEIHFAKHTGEKRYICPDDCDYKTHDPALFTRHRQKQHGYVPQARGRGAASAKGPDTADDYTMFTGPARAPNGWTEGFEEEKNKVCSKGINEATKMSQFIVNINVGRFFPKHEIEQIQGDTMYVKGMESVKELMSGVASAMLLTYVQTSGWAAISHLIFPRTESVFRGNAHSPMKRTSLIQLSLVITFV